MATMYRLTFLPDRRAQDFPGADGNVYRLNDGSELVLRSRPCWCDGCGEVTHGERVEKVEAIGEEIASLERLAAEIRRDMSRPPLPLPGAPGDRLQREQIAALRLRRAWRLARCSPPRCLICGGTAVRFLELGEPLRAGTCSVTLEWTGFCDKSLAPSYFTSEGERIP